MRGSRQKMGFAHLENYPLREQREYRYMLTVTAKRFPALAGRQSCRFLESVPLHPPQAALGPLSPMFLVRV